MSYHCCLIRLCFRNISCKQKIQHTYFTNYFSFVLRTRSHLNSLSLSIFGGEACSHESGALSRGLCFGRSYARMQYRKDCKRFFGQLGGAWLKAKKQFRQRLWPPRRVQQQQRVWHLFMFTFRHLSSPVYWTKCCHENRKTENAIQCCKPKKDFSVSVNVTKALLMQLPDWAIFNVFNISLSFSFLSISRYCCPAIAVHGLHTATCLAISELEVTIFI